MLIYPALFSLFVHHIVFYIIIKYFLASHKKRMASTLEEGNNSYAFFKLIL